MESVEIVKSSTTRPSSSTTLVCKVTEKYHATMLTFSSGTIYYEAGFL